MLSDFCAGNVDLCTGVAGCDVPVSLEGCGLPSMLSQGPDLCLFSQAGSQPVGGQRRAGKQCWSPLSCGPALQHSCAPGCGSRSFPPSCTSPGKARPASGSVWNDLDLAEGAHSLLESAVRDFAPSAPPQPCCHRWPCPWRAWLEGSSSQCLSDLEGDAVEIFPTLNIHSLVLCVLKT